MLIGNYNNCWLGNISAMKFTTVMFNALNYSCSLSLTDLHYTFNNILLFMFNVLNQFVVA